MGRTSVASASLYIAPAFMAGRVGTSSVACPTPRIDKSATSFTRMTAATDDGKGLGGAARQRQGTPGSEGVQRGGRGFGMWRRGKRYAVIGQGTPGPGMRLGWIER